MNEREAWESYKNGYEGEAFDWSLFGALVRNKRKKLGYDRVEEFVKTVYNRTRCRLNTSTMYRIESGRQAPNAYQLIAIILSLPNLGDWFDFCACDEWKQVHEGEIPSRWRYENSVALYLETLGETNEVPSLDHVDVSTLPNCWERPECLLEKSPSER